MTRLALAVAVVAALLGACSSTTRLHRGAATLSQRALAQAQDQEGNATAESGTAQGPGSGATSGSGSKAAATSSKSASVARGGPAAVNTPLAKVRGVANGKIRIGFEVGNPDATRAAFLALGANQANDDAEPDVRDATQAVIDYVNAHGGMAGLKAEPVYHVADVTTTNWVAEGQRTCAAFTEDLEVFAAVLGGLNTIPFNCYAKLRLPILRTLYVYIHDDREFAAYPDFYHPDTMSGQRATRNYVDGLARQGYFSKGAQVGLVRYDAALYKRYADEVLKPRMAAHGAALAAEIAVKEPTSLSDFGELSGELGNAILQLRSKGVDHVLFLDEGGEVPFFMLPQAESQGYRPVYGFMSNQQTYGALEVNAPHAQLQRSLGVGWIPQGDVGRSQQPPDTPGVARCNKIYHDAGLSWPDGSDRGFGTCEAVLFLQAGLARTTRPSADSLRAGVDGLGSYDSVLAAAARFDATHHDGASAVRDFAFLDKCDCFQYTSALTPAT